MKKNRPHANTSHISTTKTQSRNSSHSSSKKGSRDVYNGVQRHNSSGQNSHKANQSKEHQLKNLRTVTGTHAVKEILNIRPETVKQALVQKNAFNNLDIKEIVDLLKSENIRFEERSEPELYKICPTHQGVVLYSNDDREFDYLNTGWEEQSLIVALDGVEDPHNLGAVLRTSWLMGVKGLIIPQDRAVGLTATAHKVACGGVEHVPVARANNFSDVFSELKEAGFWVYGLSHKAKKTIYEIDFPEKVILAMGAEDKGLRTTTERACDELVCIPQISAEASYNVSVATALAISEVQRQRKFK